MTQKGELTIRSLHKSFNRGAEKLNVLSEIDFSVKPGQFVTFIGPSGCGKSTLLKIVAGLDSEYEGSVVLSGKEITRPSKEKGVIFQEHRLFPWLTVEQNIAADLSLRTPEMRKQVDDIIALVKLQGFEKSYPRELSGGMSQRVAIARALLRNPEVLLLDEPFGALDAFTKTHMQEALLDIWEKNGTTMLLVTHDIDEAVFLSNRIYVMGARPGTIKSTITIDLPYPRDKAGISFQQFRTKVLSALNDTSPVLTGWEI